MPSFVNNNNTKKDGSQEEPKKQSGSSVFNRNSDEKITFTEIEPRWNLDEIILDSKVKEEIKDIIAFCQKQKELIEKFDLDKFLKGRASVGINLYGEPGTGKSITAEAIAKALGRKMIEVNYADIQSEKWGGTEKRLSALFKHAEDNGVVIFMDEADGLMGKRSSAGANSDVTNQIKSHLLTLIERSNVFIIYATNLFKNMDRAFFRRILFHVNYPMPKYNELVELWKLHLGSDNLPKIENEFSYEELAKMSEDLLSGGDIKNLTLKLCVKIGVGKIPALTNEIVKNEIDLYQKSLNDSKGIEMREMSKEEMEDLKKNDKETYNKLTDNN